jgi:hypothetical protein
MNSYKELWIQEFDKRVDEQEEMGMTWEEAYGYVGDKECDLITERATDRYSSLVDYYSDRV